jgi:hypothetical protein
MGCLPLGFQIADFRRQISEINLKSEVRNLKYASRADEDLIEGYRRAAISVLRELNQEPGLTLTAQTNRPKHE